MAMKNDAKFDKKLTGRVKIDMMNLTKFDPSTQKSQQISLQGAHIKYVGGEARGFYKFF